MTQCAACDALHTMALVFVEVDDPDVCQDTATLEIYTYNELFRTQVRNLLGPVDRVLGFAVDRTVLTRMLLIQGYLHSDLSPGITFTLHQDGRLALAAEPNSKTRPTLSALRRRLWAGRGSLRPVPVPAPLRGGKPGRGFHTR